MPSILNLRLRNLSNRTRLHNPVAKSHKPARHERHAAHPSFTPLLGVDSQVVHFHRDRKSIADWTAPSSGGAPHISSDGAAARGMVLRQHHAMRLTGLGSKGQTGGSTQCPWVVTPWGGHRERNRESPLVRVRSQALVIHEVAKARGLAVADVLAQTGALPV